MKTLTLSIPQLWFIVATRAALAFGAGLLTSAKIPAHRSRAIGLTLVGIGAATTVPAVTTIRKRINR